MQVKRNATIHNTNRLSREMSAYERALQRKQSYLEAEERNKAALEDLKALKEERAKDQLETLPRWFDACFDQCCKAGFKRVYFQEIVHSGDLYELVIGPSLSITHSENRTIVLYAPWQKVKELIIKTFPKEFYDLDVGAFDVKVMLRDVGEREA